MITLVSTEGYMTIRMIGTVAHLEGDLTMTSIEDNLDSMMHSLNQLESDGKSSLWINCEQIFETDSSGLQLLNVWIECARLRGIEPKLVNVTDEMLWAINMFGYSHLFSDIYTDSPC
jgi:ABC-type transporter Mla MlaB component